MSSSNGSSQEQLPPESTPAPTLKAPRDAGFGAAFDAAKAKLADKTALKDFFLAREFWLPADLNSSDKARHGAPVSLIHSVLRVTFGQHGVEWESFLAGGLLGKTITEALQQRLEAGETVPVQDPLSYLDVNVPGQKSVKLAVRRKKKDGTAKSESRDAIFYVNNLKCRKGLLLNWENVSGEGDAACFKLPFSSPNDSAAFASLKRLLAHLKVSDLSKLSFNIDAATRAPEGVIPSATDQTSPQAFSSPSSALSVMKPFVGQYSSADMLEIYVQLLVNGTVLSTTVKRHGPGPDCSKSLVITGSFDGTICDEVLTTGKDDCRVDLHVTRQYSQLVQSSFPSAEWELSIPLPSDVDTRKECRGLKRLASGTHVFTIQKKRHEPAVETVEEW